MSAEEETKRLMTLKEYCILDSDQEEKFERMTALASRIFDVPICLVTLVDIGRQWFMSNRYVSFKSEGNSCAIYVLQYSYLTFPSCSSCYKNEQRPWRW